MDACLCAFDAKSGRELRQGSLPVPGVANPMTYVWKGEQYVVIATSGHSEGGTSIGDSIMAFGLPRAGKRAPLSSRTIDRPGGRLRCRADHCSCSASLLPPDASSGCARCLRAGRSMAERHTPRAYLALQRFGDKCRRALRRRTQEWRRQCRLDAGTCVHAAEPGQERRILEDGAAFRRRSDIM